MLSNGKRMGATSLMVVVAVMIVSIQVNTALAVNSVTVGSATVLPGQTGVTIPIEIENDVPLRTIVVPLIVREVSSGAYITSLKVQWSERMGSFHASDISLTQIREVDGPCGVDGLGTVLFGDQNSHPVSAPVGISMVWIKVLGTNFPPGADTSGSILLTLDIALPEGVFEIDATCSDLSNVLSFVDENGAKITPTFQKGTITVTLPLTFTLNSPNGSEVLLAGTSHEIQWTSSGAASSVSLEYSIDDAVSWTVITPSTPNDGSFTWLVPNTPSTQCRVRVCDESLPDCDISDNTFTIESPGAVENKITVESITIFAGKTGVTIPIKIENTVPLVAFVVPLVIREISGGAYITSLQAQWSERMGSIHSTDVNVTQIRQIDGACGAEGLGTILFNDQNSHPVSSPVGAFLVWAKAQGTNFAAGADIGGSALLTVDVALPEGVFEIDVSCADAANILEFIDDDLNVIIPAFQKGTITVESCSNSPGDANSDEIISEPDIEFLDSFLNSGGPAPAPLGNGDANGDCIINGSDTEYLVSIVFSGAEPVDCTCNNPTVEFSSCCGLAGDANNDGNVNVADVTFLIARIFASASAPPCADEGDTNGDNGVNIADVTFLIARIFAGGAAPVCGTTGI